MNNGVNAWQLVQAKAEFKTLVSGNTPDKVFGVVKNGSTLRQGRSEGGPHAVQCPHTGKNDQDCIECS